MKKELKESILAFIEESSHGIYNVQLADELRETLTRKRGRVKGKKYPRKSAEKDNGFVDSPMLGRQLDISMLTG